MYAQRRLKPAGASAQSDQSSWLSKLCPVKIMVRLRDYKTFFMLNSAEHEIFSANKYEQLFLC